MNNINHDRIIDRHALTQYVPYSLTHIGRLEAVGSFPKRIQLGSNRVGWSLSEIQAWIEERRDIRDADHPCPKGEAS